MPPAKRPKRKRPVLHNPPPKNARAPKPPPAEPLDTPPTRAGVGRWFATGVLDGLIFALAAVISAVVQMRTGFRWMILVGVIVAVVLTNLRRLPVRHKAVKAGYFGGLAGLFALGMLSLLLFMPRNAWESVLLFAGGMAVVSIGSIIIGLRSVPPEADNGNAEPPVSP